MVEIFGLKFHLSYLHTPQWIPLLYRRVQKIEQIKPEHRDSYQNNRTKNAIEWHWSPTSEMVRTLIKFH